MCFLVIIFRIFSVIFHIFTESEVIDIIGKNIFITIVAIASIIILINTKRSWIQLDSTSMIVHFPKKLLWLKMETLEIPYKDIQILRVVQLWFKSILWDIINIKYKGKTEALSICSLADINNFEQEMENRWIYINYDMDHHEFQKKIDTFNAKAIDVKKEKQEAFSQDMSNQSNWIKFWCWMWLTTILFIVIGFMVLAFTWYCWKTGLINADFSSPKYFVPAVCFVLICACVVYIRKTSYVKICPGNIIIRKYKGLGALKKYELHPWDIEYVNVVEVWLTYTVYIKTKNQEDKIVIKHINDWEKLKNYLNAVWNITSENFTRISNHKIWYNVWEVDKYLQSLNEKYPEYKNWNKYCCSCSYTIKWLYIFISLIYLAVILSLIMVNHNINMSLVLLIFPVLFLFYYTIIRIVWGERSFVELNEKDIKISRPKWYIFKMDETTINYQDIKSFVLKKKSKNLWYNVYLYFSDPYKGKKYIFFNVDDGINFKNELKWRWIKVYLKS